MQQVGIEMNEEVVARLNELPSATTPAERQFALHYTAAYWDGKGDVFENGPLLGGATRALGMGMMFNEKRHPDSLLQTYDWWSSHEALDVSTEDIKALVSRLDTDEATTVWRAFVDGSFLPLFESIHRYQDYGDLVAPHVGYLPGHRGDTASDSAATFQAPDREFGLAFIDGCKSWYGTKHWFCEMAPHFRPGTSILFQDFGHYTCFWLPMLIGLMPDRFKLRGYVDYTYLFVLEDPPTAAEVEAVFPDEPTDLPAQTYDDTLGPLLMAAGERGDGREVLLLQMQRAAAYAYIGKTDEAREILDRLLTQADWASFRAYLKQARVSPTYTPEGRIEL
jgi:hypothetical protein